MNREETEQQLIALGVPRHVASYVAEQRPLRIPSLGGFGVVAVMIAGFAVGGYWLWPWLEAMLDRNARTAAETTGALLYYHNFGIGLLIALFAWIGASSVLVGALPALSSRLAAGQFLDSISSASVSGDTLAARSARWGVEKLLCELKDEPDPARYVYRFCFSWLKPALMLTAAALTIAGVVTYREVNAYRLYYADRYEEQHTFKPSRTVRAWSGAARVEVGCNHTDRGNDPIYDVHFRDGGDTRIDGAIPISGSWLDQMEIIDAALVNAGARFEPWSWLDRDPYAPQCLMAYSSWLSDGDYRRFQRLIRAPARPRDLPPS